MVAVDGIEDGVTFIPCHNGGNTPYCNSTSRAHTRSIYVGNRSKRSSIMWASVRRAHKHKPTSKYTYAQAVLGDVAQISPTPTNE